MDYTDLLKKSVAQYRAIVDFISAAAEMLARAQPHDTKLYCGRLQVMQDEAKHTDLALADLFAADNMDWQALPLFRERLALMREVVEHNRLLFPKINGMMSVISAEIRQIKEGAAAMSGYKMTQKRAGGILNNTC